MYSHTARDYRGWSLKESLSGRAFKQLAPMCYLADADVGLGGKVDV